MVHQGWVESVLTELNDEASRRRDTAEAMMFRQAAGLIAQFQAKGRQNPDVQTVNMVCAQLSAAYYREMNRMFKRSNFNLCSQAEMVLRQLAKEHELHRPVKGKWRIWPSSSRSYRTLGTAAKAYLRDRGPRCVGGEVVPCGSKAEWIVAGPQTVGAETCMEIAGACDRHRDVVGGPQILGGDDPDLVEFFAIEDL